MCGECRSLLITRHHGGASFLHHARPLAHTHPADAANGDWGHPPNDGVTCMGHEGAGVVAAVGAGVTGWRVGDKAGCPPLYTACQACEFCVAGGTSGVGGAELCCALRCADDLSTRSYQPYPPSRPALLLCLVTDFAGFNVISNPNNFRRLLGPTFLCFMRMLHASAESLCAKRELLAVHRNGTFCQYVAFDAKFAVPLPDNVSYEQAAPFMCSGGTAYAALKAAGLKAGNYLVAIGSAGGVGHMVVQFARAMGLHVIAVDVGADKEAGTLACGAEAYIDVTQEKDLPGKVKSLTGGLGAHGVSVKRMGELTPRSSSRRAVARRTSLPRRSCARSVCSWLSASVSSFALAGEPRSTPQRQRARPSPAPTPAWCASPA